MDANRERTATVVELVEGQALIAFEDGSRRRVAIPAEVDIRPGQSVRLVEFEDGSPPIFDWSYGREATIRKVYVRLLDEGVDVWRPVRALHESDDVYLILSEPVEGEKWEFPSRLSGRCRVKTFADGSEALVAAERVEPATNA